MDWIKSTGKIIYDPIPKSSKKKDNTHKFDPWWVILQCDWGIVEYNNYWLKKRGIHLHTHSLFGSHVSIINGNKEEPPDKTLWKSRHGKIVEFEYNNIILDDNTHWWIWARCPEFAELRIELGLSPIPRMKYHITVGRSKEKY